MPVIESLRASSASSITSANTGGENINLRTSSASNINLNIESDYIECKTSSGSSITIRNGTKYRGLLLAEVILTQRTYLLTK
jgi:hypothetical protein